MLRLLLRTFQYVLRTLTEDDSQVCVDDTVSAHWPQLDAFAPPRMGRGARAALRLVVFGVMLFAVLYRIVRARTSADLGDAKARQLATLRMRMLDLAQRESRSKRSVRQSRLRCE